MNRRGTIADTDVAHRVDEVTVAVERLTVALEHDADLLVILQRVCRQVVHAIPGTGMASVTLLREDRPYTATSTSDGAALIDQAQYDTGEGPCLEAARTGKVQRVEVGEAAQRWPEFAAVAGDAAVAGSLSTPLFIDGTYQGSLNLYRTERDGFSSLDAALVELYTTAAESALRGARRYRVAQDTIAQLRAALTSRAVIDQAKGILMALHGITAEDAFGMLITQSQHRNVKLREVAGEFVADAVHSSR